MARKLKMKRTTPQFKKQMDVEKREGSGKRESGVGWRQERKAEEEGEWSRMKAGGIGVEGSGISALNIYFAHSFLLLRLYLTEKKNLIQRGGGVSGRGRGCMGYWGRVSFGRKPDKHNRFVLWATIIAFDCRTDGQEFGTANSNWQLKWTKRFFRYPSVSLAKV